MNRRSRLSAADLRKEVEKARLYPFYLLHGVEDYQRDETAAWLVGKLSPDQAADFNVDMFYGDTLEPEDFLKIYNAYPMMAAHRLVVIKRCEKLDLDICKGLESILESPSATTRLILVGGKVDMRRRFFRKLAEEGRAVEFRVPYANQLPQWVETHATRQGLKIDPEAVDLLIFYIGPNLRELAGEIDKLGIFVGSGGNITPATVEQAAGSSNRTSIFELADAIGNRDSRKSFLLLRALMDRGEEPARVLALIGRHIQLLLKARALMKRKTSRKQMAADLGISPYFLKSYLDQARFYPANRLWKGLGALREADFGLKSHGRRQEALIVDLLVRQLCSTTRRGRG